MLLSRHVSEDGGGGGGDSSFQNQLGRTNLWGWSVIRWGYHIPPDDSQKKTLTSFFSTSEQAPGSAGGRPASLI